MTPFVERPAGSERPLAVQHRAADHLQRESDEQFRRGMRAVEDFDDKFEFVGRFNPAVARDAVDHPLCVGVADIAARLRLLDDINRKRLDEILVPLPALLRDTSVQGKQSVSFDLRYDAIAKDLAAEVAYIVGLYLARFLQQAGEIGTRMLGAQHLHSASALKDTQSCLKSTGQNLGFRKGRW